MPVRLSTPAFCLLTSVFCLLCASPAAAQQSPKEPLPPFAADVHGIFARHKVEPDIAKGLDVETGNLPTRSWGLAGGGHVYVLRGRKIALGFGGTMLFAGGKKTLETTATDGTVTKSPTVRRHFRSLNPEVSLNFGHRNGWSYISGGFFGQSTLYVDREDKPATNAPRRKTLTYGAGARWFASDHLAFSVDVRWYSVAEMVPSADSTVVFEPRPTLMVLSGGISIK
jgi:hypothetical protein